MDREPLHKPPEIMKRSQYDSHSYNSLNSQLINFGHRKNSEAVPTNSGFTYRNAKKTITIGNDQDYYEMSAQMRSPITK